MILCHPSHIQIPFIPFILSRLLARIVGSITTDVRNIISKIQLLKLSEDASAIVTMTKGVTADPSFDRQSHNCVACGSNAKKRPTAYVSLTSSQIDIRSKVDTDPLENPFVGKTSRPFLLCTECRSTKVGWSVISDPKRFGARSRSALKGWKRRVLPTQSGKGYSCYICASLRRLGLNFKLPTDSQLKKSASVTLQIFQILLYSDDVQKDFRDELCKLSRIEDEDARHILNSIAATRFCHFHHNHARHSVDAAMRRDPNSRGMKRGYCVFNGFGCIGTSAALRPVNV